MSSILAQCAPSRWVEFLSIPDDAAPTHMGEDVDLFIGKNKKVTLTITNGEEMRFRDIVVLGELILLSSDPEKPENKAKVIARDVFDIGNFERKLPIECRNYLKNPRSTFDTELQELFTEWLHIQREAAEQIGLKSILVQDPKENKLGKFDSSTFSRHLIELHQLVGRR